MSRSNPMHHNDWPEEDPEENPTQGSVWPFPPRLLDYPGIPPTQPGRVTAKDLEGMEDAPF